MASAPAVEGSWSLPTFCRIELYLNWLCLETLAKEPQAVEESPKPKVEQPAVETSPPPANVENTPKTWAHRVGGGGGGSKPLNTMASAPVQKSPPAPAAGGAASAARPPQAARPNVQTNGELWTITQFSLYSKGIVLFHFYRQPNRTRRTSHIPWRNSQEHGTRQHQHCWAGNQGRVFKWAFLFLFEVSSYPA